MQRDSVPHIDILSVGILHEAVLGFSQHRAVDDFWAAVALNSRWVVPARRICILCNRNGDRCEVLAQVKQGQQLLPESPVVSLGDDSIAAVVALTRPAWLDRPWEQLTGDDALRTWLRASTASVVHAVPLVTGDRNLGVVLLEVEQPGEDADRARISALASLYARHAASTCGAIEANEALSVKNRELESAQNELVQAADEIRTLNTTLESRIEARTQELERAQQDLLKAERLATLGKLTATVAHEIRNPLGVISASSMLLENLLQDPEGRVQEILGRMTRNIERCDRVVSELLDFTRIAGSGLREIAFDSWLHEVLDEYPLGMGIEIERDLRSADAIVKFDADLLRRAVLNFLDNACQAMMGSPEEDPSEAGGRVTIHTHVLGEMLNLEISDTGCGISETVKPRIFEPLFSTKSFGVGLGLSVVRQIVEQHGGEFDIKSTENTGTTAALRIPRTQPR
jgi:signal transduction histidine kinase